MFLSDFDFDLPPELIAQTAVEPRDSSRLLAFDRDSQNAEHRSFRDLPELLQAGDVLVLNNTKVLPARLSTTEGREVFLVKKVKSPPTPLYQRGEASPAGEQGDLEVWECMVRGGKFFQPGARFEIGEDLSGEVLEILADGERVIRFTSTDFAAALDKYGATPLPPYIEQTERTVDRYQTVYSKEEKKDSVAAPTAGLHFTPELFEQLKEKGVQMEEVTLAVGLGTFLPVKVEKITEHEMHTEFYELPTATAERINAAKKEGRRVIAVGTTSCRVLESCADADGVLQAGVGETDIFIYPGYSFKILDGLITNFHLPKSTLLMLVSALIGREKCLELYETAIKEKYRFYSFGDAMLLL